ncbi:unnamed protein product, partial [Iphiclides podalirius]
MVARLIICACLLTSVSAKPTCKIYGAAKTAVICKRGESDFTLQRGLVSDRNVTTKVVLRACGISQVDLESFENLPSLKHLDLSQNKIQNLELGVLDGLTKLNHLNLSYNSITNLPLGLFDQIPNLLNLDFSANGLSSLELGVLDPLTKIKALNLSSNSLIGKNISPYLFDQNPHISVLDLSRNDMSRAPNNLLHSLQSLESFTLDRAFLAEVPKFATSPNLKTMKRLVLSTNQIQKIDDATVFVNLENLEVLDLERNNLESINENVFKPLRKLKGIYLRSNKLREIPINLFQNLPKLVNLDLAHNFIASFSARGLIGTSLKNLNLSDNGITFMPEKFCSQLKDIGVNLSKFFFNPNPWQCLFDQKPNLKLLDLRGNTIKNLKLGVFDALTKLQHLDLSSNSLVGKDINPYIFDRSKQIKFVDFSRNDMSESPDNLLHAFRALDFVNLDRCFLKAVPRFATIPNLKNLKHLMLSTNLISKIDNAATFVNLDNLEILNLAENCLEFINEHALKPLRNLKMVVLRDNKLKHVPDDLFRNLPVLANIDLSNNALTAIPVNFFRGTVLKNLNLSNNKFTYLQYNFCLELKNSGARLTRFFFNQNPWQCACLKDVLREVKAMSVEYNSAKYDGQHPVCVTQDEFVCHRHQNHNDAYIKLFESVIA